MKKERIRLETLEIPDIPEDDIVEVITNVKELLQKRAVKKYESSILKSLRELLYVHGWKSIVLQGGLTLLVALAVWLCLPNGYKMKFCSLSFTWKLSVVCCCYSRGFSDVISMV